MNCAPVGLFLGWIESVFHYGQQVIPFDSDSRGRDGDPDTVCFLCDSEYFFHTHHRWFFETDSWNVRFYLISGSGMHEGKTS